MKTIAFATCLRAPEMTESDQIAAAALNRRGVDVIAAPWNGPATPFDKADLVVVRSTWDYWDYMPAFPKWLGSHGAARTVNAPMLMQWNLDKRYLLELQENGVRLPPTRLVEPTETDIAAALDSLEVDDAVVKPRVSGGAFGLTRVKRGDRRRIIDAAAALTGPGLVQPVIADIETDGEVSLVFFDGVFSHAVLKRPKAGDIRVQEQHGGVTRAFEPPAPLIEAGQSILRQLPEAACYARIDGLALDDGFLLMEVEVIEPSLFFEYAPEAAERFAAALLKRLD